MGKTTTLAHLAAVLPSDQGIVLVDDASPESGVIYEGTVVFTSNRPGSMCASVSYRLMPWGNDELLEYLLAVHPARCRSVMARLQAVPDRRLPQGIPELWRIVLDRMAEDESLTSVADALRREVHRQLRTAKQRARVEEYCLAAMTVLTKRAAKCYLELRRLDVKDEVLRLLRHDGVQLTIATDRLVRLLESNSGHRALEERLRRELVRTAAAAASSSAVQNLSHWLARNGKGCQPMAASLLHARGAGWRPDRHPVPLLSGAYLDGAVWKSIDLSGARVEGTDLSSSDLSGSVLDGASAAGADFSRSVLHGASLAGIYGGGANFELAVLTSVNARAAVLREATLAGADLTGASLSNVDFFGANLADACFAHSDLTYSTLAEAMIDGADFSSADLSWSCLNGLSLRSARLAGAVFAHAFLQACDLEDIDLPGADFTQAHLEGALLTGSRMPRASFAGASLGGARLADIQWEGVDLRHADMRQCTFHLGSSRSGLVGSPIACEGSRTGFYGDEFDQQTYRAPEEIRKANLCGADLRDANIEGTDFYLVDLRYAKYGDAQLEHFRRCGAILFDRAPRQG